MSLILKFVNREFYRKGCFNQLHRKDNYIEIYVCKNSRQWRANAA